MLFRSLGVATGTSIQVTGGFYSSSSSAFTFTDGIVVDYITGTGRFSVGSSDGFAWYNGGVANTSLATLSSAGAFTAVSVTGSSDERLKTNWRNLPEDFVEQLAKVKHGIYDRTDIELTQVGVGAQSLQKVLEYAVSENEDGNLAVAYGNAALVAAVKLAGRVVELEAKLEQLIKDKS